MSWSNTDNGEINVNANINMNRAELRNTLLSNGYTPLPLLTNGKGLHIKGWSRQAVTAEWLDQYARRTDYTNTGLRCDHLAAFDLDILDERLSDAAEAIVEDHCGETELCRYGRFPKRLLVYAMRGKPPFKSARTGKYGEHRAELLCGSGRQFAAFGMHPSGQPYTWDTVSPLEVAVKKLHKVDYATAQGCLNALEQLLIDTGLAEESPGLAFGHAGHQEYDLTDTFECLIDGVVVTWGELKPTLDKDGVFGNIKREHDVFGDSDAAHFMLAAGSDLPCIHDFVRDCTHWDCTITPELAAALPAPAPVTVFTPDPLADLLEKWVVIGDKSVRDINHPMEALTIDGFKLINRHQKIPDPNNVAKTIQAVNAWVDHPDAMRARAVELCPDVPEQVLVTRDDRTIFNTYAPPLHPEQGGEAATALEFIEHLIPNPLERQQFIDWHAVKVANPSYRMHGLVLVTRAYGTGRGVWFQILGKLFGPEYVCPIVLSDLIGGNSQSAYNEYLADNLILTVAEAFEEKEDTSRWTVRHSAYEKLKVLIEPAASFVRVKRKYGGILKAMCYASTEIATNHTDALAIEPGDRRLIVLDCTDVPLWEADGDLKNRIVDWMSNAKNIGALERWLRERATETHYNPFDLPIMTAAKERMIEAGQSDTDAAYDYMLENADGDLVTIEQFGAFARRAGIDLGLELPMAADLLKRSLTAVLQKRAKKVSGLPKSGIKVGGKVPVRPWIIRNFEQWKGSTDHPKIKAEILRNGTPGDNILDFRLTKPLK
jgi:hypothetical protein